MKYFYRSILAFSLVILSLLSFETKAQLTVSYTYTTNGAWVNYVYTTNGTNIINKTWSFTGAIQSKFSSAKYPHPGTYYTCITIKDTLLRTASYCDSVIVPCKAKFLRSNSLLVAHFKNKSFISGHDYSWNFGDGSALSTAVSPNHTYAAAGTYNVCLTVVDSLTSCTSSYCDSITVIASYQCNANFSYSVVSPGKVLFTNKSTANYNLVRHSWDLGNGHKFNNYSNFYYRYYVDGMYQVCLTVSDTNLLCTSTFCDSVLITGAPPKKYLLSGRVDKDTLAKDSMRVYLIKADSTTGSVFLTAVDSVDSESFNFSIVEGTYFVKGALISGSQNYKKQLPTYFTNKLLWANATPIHLKQNRNIKFSLIKGTNLGGPGFISGYITLGANLIPGDPIPGLDIILMDEADVPVAYAKSDQDGKYSFSNLALGTYKIYADLLNIPAIPIYVTLDKDNTSMTNANLQVNSTGVGAPVGIKTSKAENIQWTVYPNPSDGNFIIKLNSFNVEEIIIEVMDLRGAIIHQQTELLQTGENSISFNLNAVKSGIYFIRINSEEINVSGKIRIE